MENPYLEFTNYAEGIPVYYVGGASRAQTKSAPFGHYFMTKTVNPVADPEDAQELFRQLSIMFTAQFDQHIETGEGINEFSRYMLDIWNRYRNKQDWRGAVAIRIYDGKYKVSCYHQDAQGFEVMGIIMFLFLFFHASECVDVEDHEGSIWRVFPGYAAW